MKSQYSPLVGKNTVCFEEERMEESKRIRGKIGPIGLGLNSRDGDGWVGGQAGRQSTK